MGVKHASAYGNEKELLGSDGVINVNFCQEVLHDKNVLWVAGPGVLNMLYLVKNLLEC